MHFDFNSLTISSIIAGAAMDLHNAPRIFVPTMELPATEETHCHFNHLYPLVTQQADEDKPIYVQERKQNTDGTGYNL